jgi:hypothetical protein
MGPWTSAKRAAGAHSSTATVKAGARAPTVETSATEAASTTVKSSATMKAASAAMETAATAMKASTTAVTAPMLRDSRRGRTQQCRASDACKKSLEQSGSFHGVILHLRAVPATCHSAERARARRLNQSLIGVLFNIRIPPPDLRCLEGRTPEREHTTLCELIDRKQQS